MEQKVIKGAHVTIIIDDETFEFTYENKNESLIDAAEQADIDVPSSCMAGVCSSCRARLKEGKVSMDETHSLMDDEIEMGYILTCQSKPLTDKVVIDFDDL